MEFDIQMPQVSQHRHWIPILYQVLPGCEDGERRSCTLQQDLRKDSMKRQMIDRSKPLSLIGFSPLAEGKSLKTVKLSYNSSI